MTLITNLFIHVEKKKADMMFDDEDNLINEDGNANFCDKENFPDAYKNKTENKSALQLSDIFIKPSDLGIKTRKEENRLLGICSLMLVSGLCAAISTNMSTAIDPEDYAKMNKSQKIATQLLARDFEVNDQDTTYIVPAKIHRDIINSPAFKNPKP